MALSITFYNYNDKINKVDKTAALANTGTTLSGDQLENDQPLTDISVIISSTSAPTYNYCYVADFKRYYFVNSITWIGGTAYRFDLHVDVLMTYKTNIGNLYALVNYSGSGKILTVDDRVRVNSVPTKEETDVEMSVNYIWAIMLRYQWAAVEPDNVGIRCAIMSLEAWQNFQTSYRALTEAKRVAVARQMIDVTLIRTPSTNISTQFSALSRSNVVQFWVEDFGAAGQSGYINVDVDPNTTGVRAFFIRSRADSRLLQNVAFTIDDEVNNDNVNTINSDYKIFIPHVGIYFYNLFKEGIYDAETFGIVIDFDPFGNTYYVTPVINIDNAGDYDYAQTDDIQSFPVTTTYSFTIDNDYNNAGWLNLTNGVNTFFSAYGGLLTNDLVGTVQSIGNYNDYISRNYLKAATGWEMKSTVGGSLTYVSTVDPDKILIEKIYFPYLGDIDDFHAEYGLPDGEYRSLYFLSGYAEIGKVTMTGFNNATKSEIDEVERLLKAGVFF